MNQILVSEKIYVTKEMKRKKRIYRALYFFSLFVIIILLTYYVLAEKDRNDQEAIGQEIGMEIEKLVGADDETTARKPLVVSLDEDNVEDPNVQLVNNEPEETPPPASQSTTSSVSASNGKSYESEAIFEYPKLGIKYPVLTDDSEASLKISLCKFWGPAPNTEGNYVIVGHNYKSGKMFGKLYQAQNGDNVTLKDYSGNEKVYRVYDMYTVDPTDLGCTSQMTNGRRELTLITCTEYGQKRRVIKCVEI